MDNIGLSQNIEVNTRTIFVKLRVVVDNINSKIIYSLQ